MLNLTNKIGKKSRGGGKDRKYFQVQFGDVAFYKFLLDIGLMPAKSKVLEKKLVSDEFFFDFLRGHFDGDGTFYSYWDPRWRSSFMFYTVFISASKNHIFWLKEHLSQKLGIKGHITRNSSNVCLQLKYAKSESLKLLREVYYNPSDGFFLNRKYLKIKKALSIIGESL